MYKRFRLYIVYDYHNASEASINARQSSKSLTDFGMQLSLKIPLCLETELYLLPPVSI